MKLAVIGSRNFTNYYVLEQEILNNFAVGDITEIVSGGATGADFLAEQFAARHKIKLTRFLPNYKKFADRPKYAPLDRNKQIAEYCDKAIAFSVNNSGGTRYTIEVLRSINKPTIVVNINSI